MKNLITVLILISAATISVAAQCSEADKRALKAFDAAWSVAGQNGDRAKLMSIYADDYVGFPSMENKTTAINNTMQAFEQNRANPAAVPQTAYGHYLISCTPASATVTHRNATTSANGTVTYSRSVHVFEKRGGQWVVVSNAGGPLTDSQVIWYLEQDWNDAILKKDKAWFESNFAMDFSSVDSVTGALLNRTQDIAGATSASLTVDAAETTDMSIRVDGDRAIVNGVFRMKGRDSDGPFDRRMRYTDVWVKRDGRWQAWSSQGTLIK